MQEPRDIIEYRHAGADTWEITDIKVRSKRRKGVGTKLVLEAIRDMQDAKRLYAITRKSNTIAHRFYESLDMKPIPLPNFYAEEDAIMYLMEV